VTSKIHDIVIDSCIYVYTADVDGSGCISEAEYVIFKLRQMQAVDADVLNMLMDHFEELDINNTKSLIIGVNIPSKDQLIELEATVKDPNKEHEKVNAAWRKMKSVVLAEMGLESALEAVDDEDHDEPRSESEAKYKKLSMIAKMYLALQRARGQAKKSLFDVFVDKVEKEEEPPEPSPDRSAARSISMDFAQLELLSLVPTVEVPAIPTSPSLTNMMPDMSGLPGSPSMSSKDITDMMPSTDMMPKLDDLSSMTSGFFSSGSEPSTPKSLGVSL
jgi:hypothetical protein